MAGWSCRSRQRNIKSYCLKIWKSLSNANTEPPCSFFLREKVDVMSLRAPVAKQSPNQRRLLTCTACDASVVCQRFDYVRTPLGEPSSLRSHRPDVFREREGLTYFQGTTISAWLSSAA